MIKLLDNWKSWGILKLQNLIISLKVEQRMINLELLISLQNGNIIGFLTNNFLPIHFLKIPQKLKIPTCLILTAAGYTLLNLHLIIVKKVQKIGHFLRRDLIIRNKLDNFINFIQLVKRVNVDSLNQSKLFVFIQIMLSCLNLVILLVN